MSCYSNDELEQMLEDVVNALDLAEDVIEEHGPMGTPPAELVTLVLEEKNRTIRNLRAGMARKAASKDAEIKRLRAALAECLRLENEASGRLSYQNCRDAQDSLCEMSAAIRGALTEGGE